MIWLRDCCFLQSLTGGVALLGDVRRYNNLVRVVSSGSEVGDDGTLIEGVSRMTARERGYLWFQEGS